MIYLCACVEVGRISWYVSALSTHFQTSETVHYAFSCLVRLVRALVTPLTRPADFFKCSNACRPVQWDVN